MARSTRAKGGAKAPVRGYDNWTVGEMRQKLSRRSREDLESLLDYEKRGKNRKSAVEALERAIERKSEDEGTPRRSVRDRAGTVVKTVVDKVRSVVSGSEVDREALIEKLGEYLEHEQGGVQLYEKGLELVEDEDQREHLEHYLEETRTHVQALTDMIGRLGGDANVRTEAVELVRQKGEALLASCEAEGEAGKAPFFVNLAIAEFVDHQNWKFLESIASQVNDEEIRTVLQDYVGEIEDQEDEHWRWAMRQAELEQQCQLFPDQAGDEEREAA